MNHVNEVFLIRYDDTQYVKGDAFWPQLTGRMPDAARLDSLKSAKAYVKTATPRLKKEGFKGELKIVKAIAERDENFNLVSIKEVKS